MPVRDTTGPAGAGVAGRDTGGAEAANGVAVRATAGGGVAVRATAGPVAVRAIAGGTFVVDVVVREMVGPVAVVVRDTTGACCGACWLDFVRLTAGAAAGAASLGNNNAPRLRSF